MIEKDVQKRILKAIVSNGGIANTQEVIELSGLSRTSVHHGTKHLVSRALISKKTIKRKAKRFLPPYKTCIFKINKNLMPKIKRLISEIGK